jgi:hypothetical protein
MPIELSEQERYSVIAGLKLLDAMARNQTLDATERNAIMEIATGYFKHEVLNPEEIDKLCDRMEGKG